MISFAIFQSLCYFLFFKIYWDLIFNAIAVVSAFIATIVFGLESWFLFIRRNCHWFLLLLLFSLAIGFHSRILDLYLRALFCAACLIIFWAIFQVTFLFWRRWWWWWLSLTIFWLIRFFIFLGNLDFAITVFSAAVNLLRRLWLNIWRIVWITCRSFVVFLLNLHLPDLRHFLILLKIFI